MRAAPAETKSASPATSEGEPAETVAALTGMLDRMSAERAACENLGDPELARCAGRKVLTAVACAADAILADARLLQSAPDKLAAFFDKSAAACVAAIEGLHKRAELAAGNDVAPSRPRAADPLAASIAAWRAPARE